MKTALITSGGGAKGAFTVGALSYLVKEQKVSFDFISGTSTGSLIAGIIADNTKPEDNIDLLTNIYTNVNDEDLLTRANLLNQILLNNKSYIFNTEPLLKMIDSNMTEERFKNLKLPASPQVCFTAINLQTGMPTVFTNKELAKTAYYDVVIIDSREMLIKAMLASSSQAVFLPSVKIGSFQFVDGGNREVIPTRVAINAIPDIIYVISNNPSSFQILNKSFDDILSVLIRSISIFIQDVRENDLAVLSAYANKTGKKVIKIEPDTDLDIANPTGLSFKKEQMIDWMKYGKLKAEEALRQSQINVIA